MPPTYELVIGLETHVQLATASKMFCACATAADAAEPNTLTCPTCLGLPGALPVPNARAVHLATRLGLALGCDIHELTAFERKSYFYPDLPKGYQITQYRRPLCTGGALPVRVGGRDLLVDLERIHLEEDTGKLVHGPEGALVDFNRSGLPLVEVVTRPVLGSPEEAAAYVEALRQLLRWLGVSSGVMADGALRVDVNCSLRRPGEAGLGTKVEIKNLNTLAAVRDCLAYEAGRQAQLLDAGQAVAQETRGWLEGEGRTAPQRSKEQAADYRYFPEPDLPPLALPEGLLAAERAELPELPWARRSRLMADLGLREDEARLVTRNRPIADYFEAARVAHGGDGRALAGWLVGPLFGLLNAQGLEIGAAAERVPPAALAALVGLVDDGALHAGAAKEVLAGMLATGRGASEIAEERGLVAERDEARLAAWVDEVLALEAKAVADFRGGRAGVLGFLVGGVMRRSGGRADPAQARRLVEARLSGGDGP